VKTVQARRRVAVLQEVVRAAQSVEALQAQLDERMDHNSYGLVPQVRKAASLDASPYELAEITGFPLERIEGWLS
jgi:hypothetical protein